MSQDLPQPDAKPAPDDDARILRVTTRHARCVLMMRGVDIIKARRQPVWLNGGLVRVID